MGYDVKCNKKEIKVGPGPADYNNDIHDKDILKKCHNYALANGGLKKPEKLTIKE